MNNTPIVGIIMGSDSDLPVMQEAAKQLESFGIQNEVTVVSALRTPERLREYARGAAGRGLKVIIAGAGGAAHLPGMAAAQTPLPVIGVPILSKTLEGIDSLLSVAQMPVGVPVATVAINGARNAAILAAEIIGVSNEDVRRAVEEYKRSMGSEVLEKVEKLEKEGAKKYLEDKRSV